MNVTESPVVSLFLNEPPVLVQVISPVSNFVDSTVAVNLTSPPPASKLEDVPLEEFFTLTAVVEPSTIFTDNESINESLAVAVTTKFAASWLTPLIVNTVSVFNTVSVSISVSPFLTVILEGIVVTLN